MTKLRRPEQQDILQARHPFRNVNVFFLHLKREHIFQQTFYFEPQLISKMCVSSDLDSAGKMYAEFPRTYLSTDWLENIFPYLPISLIDPEKR